MGWFTPKCPIKLETKEWIEDSFKWLIEEFGQETFHNMRMILPDDQFFPDHFSGDIIS